MPLGRMMLSSYSMRSHTSCNGSLAGYFSSKSRTALRIGCSSEFHALANLRDRYNAYYWPLRTQSITLWKEQEIAGWPVLERQSYRGIAGEAKPPDRFHLHGSGPHSSD